MHLTALIGEIRHELTTTRWQGVEPHSKHDWNILVNKNLQKVAGFLLLELI